MVNGLSQTQRWNNTTIGELSDKYDNLFTPAGYAFSIWGLIFLSLVAYVVFQWNLIFFKNQRTDIIEKTGYWFALANLGNTAWVVAFTYGYIGVSVGIMIIILISLLKIIWNTGMSKSKVSLSIKIFLWGPISIYAGWITVATIANVSAFLISIGIETSAFTQIIWTMIVITVALFLNLFILGLRRTIAFCCVAIWALIAIYVRHKNGINSIAYYALASAAILGLAILKTLFWPYLSTRFPTQEHHHD